MTNSTAEIVTRSATRPVTKPVTKKGQESVDSILDATLDILERDGFSHLTTNHIAAESGVRVGSLYRFFPNKESIIVALVERWHESIINTNASYLCEKIEGMTFIEIVQGLFLLNLRSEYIHSAAYNAVYLGASTVPVLVEILTEHQQRVAKQVANVRPKNGSKSQAELLEFCVFLHGMISSALSIVAKQKGKSRVRHTQWILQMIRGAIETFEDEAKN